MLTAVAMPVGATLSASGWSAVDSLNVARISFDAATLTDGSVLVAGGGPGGGVGVSSERYNAATDEWTLTANMNVRRAAHTLTALTDGRALAAGGNSASVLLPSAELFDPGTNSWSFAPSMTAARLNHSATLLDDGRVLVAGGVVDKGGATNEVEIYDPSANVWERADSLHNPRYNHSATRLADGRVLVAGGFTPGRFHTPLKTAELYDPASDTWSVVGTTDVERAVHAAALLADGQVLVAGGVCSHRTRST